MNALLVFAFTGKKILLLSEHLPKSPVHRDDRLPLELNIFPKTILYESR